MPRPVTLFTGQWADLPLEEVCPAGRGVGLRRPRARLLGRPLRRRPRPAEDDYCAGRRDILERQRPGLGRSPTTSSARPSATTRSTSATRRSSPTASGATATPRASASGPPQEMIDTARAAAKLGVDVVNGFTGSQIWHYVSCSRRSPPR